MEISRNKWHYKYYRLVKKMWGCTNEELDRQKDTNLCAYVQCMCWGTIGYIVFFPLWLFIPIGFLLESVLWTIEWFDEKMSGKQNNGTKFEEFPRPVQAVMSTFIFAISYALLALLYGLLGIPFKYLVLTTGLIIGTLLVALVVVNKKKLCPLIQFHDPDEESSPSCHDENQTGDA
jgi:hypothetical protein